MPLPAKRNSHEFDHRWTHVTDPDHVKIILGLISVPVPHTKLMVAFAEDKSFHVVYGAALDGYVKIYDRGGFE